MFSTNDQLQTTIIYTFSPFFVTECSGWRWVCPGRDQVGSRVVPIIGWRQQIFSVDLLCFIAEVMRVLLDR